MYWRSLLESFSGVGFSDMLDITIVSCLIYFILRWFQQTKAVFVAIGIFIFTLVYLVARHTHMYVTTWIFQGFFAVFVLALVIIFQEELRSFFERLAVWSLRRRRGRAVAHLQPEHVEVLVQSLGHFAREQIGALIVLKGQDPLERHVDGGVDLDGEVSSPLLNSLFDPHSLGHDGAIVIERNRLVRFGSHLPLSKEFQKLTGLGTRHAAALGLSERTDALCIVVSEEKGIISIARNANIVPVQDLPSLEAHISAFLHETSDATSTRSPRRGVAKFFSRHLQEKSIALICAVALWCVFAQGFRPANATIRVPVAVRSVPEALHVQGVDPAWIHVNVTGMKRDMALLRHAHPTVFIAPLTPSAGTHRIAISSEHLRIPAELRVVTIEPPVVELTLTEIRERHGMGFRR